MPPEVEEAFRQAADAVPAEDPTPTDQEHVYRLEPQARQTLVDAAIAVAGQREQIRPMIPGDPLSDGSRVTGYKEVDYGADASVIYTTREGEPLSIVRTPTDEAHDFLINESGDITTRVRGAEEETEKPYEGDASELLALRDRHLQDRGTGEIRRTEIRVEDVEHRWVPGRPACTIQAGRYSVLVNIEGEQPRCTLLEWKPPGPGSRSVTVGETRPPGEARGDDDIRV